MLNLPFGVNLTQSAPFNFSDPRFLMRLQAFHEMMTTSEYPVVKHKKTDFCEPTVILDPDVFFKKEAEFNEEDISITNQATELSSLALSPNREGVFFSSFSEILTPDQSQTDIEKKSTLSQTGKEEEEEIKTTNQLEEMIDTKLCSENSGLANMIEQILQGKVTSTAEMAGLTPIEECVAEAILKKKDSSHSSKKAKGKKREEEKQKFFFKSVLKYTEAKFFGIDQSPKKRTKKKQLKKEAYYEHYWGEVAKEQKIDLSNFFHPNKKLAQGKTAAQLTSAQNPGLKSLNTTYIDLILSSEKFKADTLDYLDNVFLKESQNARSQKVSKLLAKLNSLATEARKKVAHLPAEKQLEAVKNKIFDYLVVNPKSKMPWADSELQEARDFAYGTILRQSSKARKTSF